jgi:hypothetical protein
MAVPGLARLAFAVVVRAPLRDAARGSGEIVSTSEFTAGVRLSDVQRLDWLRLIRSENVGPRGIR